MCWPGALYTFLPGMGQDPLTIHAYLHFFACSYSYQATSVYINCTMLDYSDFIALVQADMGLMKGAASCFAAKVDETEVRSLCHVAFSSK